jgi:hypothetical protein
MAQPLSGPLQAGLRFLRDPKPTALSACLTARFPPRGRRRVFHVPRTYLADGLGPDFPPVTALSAAGHLQIPAPGHLPFGRAFCPVEGPAPSARRRLRWLHQFACADHAVLTQPPTALVLAVATFLHRSVASLSAEEYFVPALTMPVGSRVQRSRSDPRSHLLRIQNDADS